MTGKKRDLTAGEKSAMGEAASLIRTHLWLSTTPPPPPDPNDRAWHMGRDLSIWQRLLFNGRDPEEINGAIEFARHIIHQDGVPLRMTIFYHAKATPVYEQARAAWINAQADVPYGGKGKVSPTIRDIMRRMAE